MGAELRLDQVSSPGRRRHQACGVVDAAVLFAVRTEGSERSSRVLDEYGEELRIEPQYKSLSNHLLHAQP